VFSETRIHNSSENKPLNQTDRIPDGKNAGGFFITTPVKAISSEQLRDVLASYRIPERCVIPSGARKPSLLLSVPAMKADFLAPLGLSTVWAGGL
jgi:hypothetical protein